MNQVIATLDALEAENQKLKAELLSSPLNRKRLVEIYVRLNRLRADIDKLESKMLKEH